MKKLLSLLCLALLPLNASALLENATVSAEVLQSPNERLLLQHDPFIAQLKALVEAQLAKMPDLSGMYVGIIRVVAAGDAEPANAEEPQVLFFRMVRLSEGHNQQWFADDRGVFKLDVMLRPEGRHWDYKGLVEYREYVAPERVMSVNTTFSLPEGVAVIGGLSSEEVRKMMAENGVQPVSSVAQQEQRIDTLTGAFFLRTADVPAPESSPTNSINRVTLPSGRIIQLEPGLSLEAAREVVSAELAKDATMHPAVNPVANPVD